MQIFTTDHLGVIYDLSKDVTSLTFSDFKRHLSAKNVSRSNISNTAYHPQKLCYIYRWSYASVSKCTVVFELNECSPSVCVM